MATGLYSLPITTKELYSLPITTTGLYSLTITTTGLYSLPITTTGLYSIPVTATKAVQFYLTQLHSPVIVMERRYNPDDVNFKYLYGSFHLNSTFLRQRCCYVRRYIHASCVVFVIASARNRNAFLISLKLPNLTHVTNGNMTMFVSST